MINENELALSIYKRDTGEERPSLGATKQIVKNTLDVVSSYGVGDVITLLHRHGADWNCRVLPSKGYVIMIVRHFVVLMLLLGSLAGIALAKQRNQSSCSASCPCGCTVDLSPVVVEPAPPDPMPMPESMPARIDQAELTARVVTCLGERWRGYDQQVSE